jgi:hypothetical protein
MMAVWLTDAEYGRTPSTTKRISGDIAKCYDRSNQSHAAATTWEKLT